MLNVQLPVIQIIGVLRVLFDLPREIRSFGRHIFKRFKVNLSIYHAIVQE
jgi:hypothetical protein